jgi:hypothetical protein
MGKEHKKDLRISEYKPNMTPCDQMTNIGIGVGANTIETREAKREI